MRRSRGMRFRDTSLTLGSLREGAPRSGGGDCGTNDEDVLRTRDISRCLRHSLTIVPRELLDVCLQTRQSLCDMPAGSLFVSLSSAEKSADGCIAVRPFIPYSSTASGPLDVFEENSTVASRHAPSQGKASVNRAFRQRSEVDFVTATTLGCRGRQPLPARLMFLLWLQTNARR